jgi:hypothetical protein
MALPADSQQFEVLSTPSPLEYRFRVLYDASKLEPDQLPIEGEAFNKSKLPSKPAFLKKHYGGYLFTHPERANEGMWFHYARNKGPRNRDAVPFKTFWTNRSYPWPAVLEDAYLVRSTFPQTAYNGSSVVKATRYFFRKKFRPPSNADSLVYVKQWVTPLEWPKEDMILQQPVLGNINVNYLGDSLSFTGLHGNYKFPEYVPGASIVYGAGNQSPPASRNPNILSFPATNFEDWAPFTLTRRQEPAQGVWLREDAIIYPPPLPDSITV